MCNIDRYIIILFSYQHDQRRYKFPRDFPKDRGSLTQHELNVCPEHFDAIDISNHYNLDQTNDNDSYGGRVPVQKL